MCLVQFRDRSNSFFNGTTVRNATVKVVAVKDMRISGELASPTTRSLPPAEIHRTGGFRPGPEAQ
jgi:hypothetical protein